MKFKFIKYLMLIVIGFFIFSGCKSSITSIEKTLIDDFDKILFYPEQYKESLYTKERVSEAKFNYIKNEIGKEEAFSFIKNELVTYPFNPYLNACFVEAAFEVDKEKYASEAIERIEQNIIGKIRKDKEDLYNVYRAAFYKLLSQEQKTKDIINNIDSDRQFDLNKKRNFELEKLRILGKVNYVNPSLIIPTEDKEKFYTILDEYFDNEKISVQKINDNIKNLSQIYPDDYSYYKLLLYFLLNIYVKEPYNEMKNIIPKILNPYINEINTLIIKDNHLGVTKSELYLIMIFYNLALENKERVFEFYKKAIDTDRNIFNIYSDIQNSIIFKSAFIFEKIKEENNEYETSEFIEEIISMIENYYSYLSLKDFDWNKTKHEIRNKSKTINDRLKTYLMINKFLSKFKDGHLSFMPSSDFRKKYIDSIHRYNNDYGIKIKNIQNKPCITYLSENIKKNNDIEIGHIILSINDMEISKIAEKQRELSFYPISNEAWQETKYDNIFNYFNDKYLSLEIKNPNNDNIKKIQIYKNFNQHIKKQPFNIVVFPNKIALLTINHFLFLKNEINDLTEQYKNKLENAKALIIDLRNNTGGNRITSNYLISTLINKKIFTHYSFYRDNPSNPQEFGPLYLNSIEPNDEINYDKPIIILISGNSFSAAELFAAGMKDSGRAIILGTTTGGGTNSIRINILSDSSFVSIPTVSILRLNGKQIENKGIEPDIEVRQTYEDLLNDVDTQLQTAIEYLNNIIDEN